MLTARVLSDPEEWNSTILSLADPHILQSWEWGEFKAKYGWTPTRIAFCEGEKTLAAAQVLRRPLPHTPFGLLYVPQGPLFALHDPALFESTLEGLVQVARAQRAIFCKIDPALPRQQDAGHAMTAALRQRNWTFSREQIQFRNTVLLDLSPGEQELLHRMKPKTRYNIRLAEKRGVRVERGGMEDLSLFYDMYVETSARDGFLIRQFSYYRDAWGSFLSAGRAQLFLARVGGEAIAGLILFVFGSRAWYFYGASRNAHRDLMPNHLLQWEAIRWAKAHGCTVYDFWGAPNALDPEEPMYGVYRFKEGFGGKFTEHIGAHDFVVRPLLYWLYAFVRPGYLARLRARHSVTLD